MLLSPLLYPSRKSRHWYYSYPPLSYASFISPSANLAHPQPCHIIRLLRIPCAELVYVTSFARLSHCNWLFALILPCYMELFHHSSSGFLPYFTPELSNRPPQHASERSTIATTWASALRFLPMDLAPDEMCILLCAARSRPR